MTEKEILIQQLNKLLGEDDIDWLISTLADITCHPNECLYLCNKKYLCTDCWRKWLRIEYNKRSEA